MSKIILAFFMSPLFAVPSIQNILDADSIDREVDPCTDFYRFSCGKWLKDFQLPADKSSYWHQGNVLSDGVEQQLNTLLASLKQASEGPATSEAKLAAFYRSCMDQKSGEDLRSQAELQAGFKQIETITDPASLAKVLAQLELVGAKGLFDYSAEQDPKDSSRVIATIDRGGMSLPDPDYYLKNDPKSREIRARYQQHLVKVLGFAGELPIASARAASWILAFETDLAKHAMKRDDRRDMNKRYHPMSYIELKNLMPDFQWDEFQSGLGIATPKHLNVVEPAFLKYLNSRLSKMKWPELILFLKAAWIHRVAYFIPGPLQNEDFAFWHNYLHGQKEMPPRWKYCTQIVSGNMSEALGQAYVASIANAKEIRVKTLEMFEEFKLAFAEDLNQLKWMDAATKTQARNKLEKLGYKIGWPDKWRDYASLKLDGQAFLQNELHSTEFEVRRNLNKIDKPMDRSEWQMAVWEPNAYYQDSNNEIVLPLGELVPPVFDPHFSDGANYASLGGSTIGHELTHGFDDSGKDMDANGNFVTWWTKEAKTRFEQQSSCFVKQAEAYDILPDSNLRIRGKATLGENLADNGGMKLGIMAIKKLMKTRPAAAKFLEFDELQQYFLAYGQGWCTKTTPQTLRDELLSGFHPPPEFRVNSVLSNQPEFAEAFHCAVGSKMAPKLRCSVW